MSLFILGLLFIFAKFNLQFLETRALYYVTNTIGYIFIYFGLRGISSGVESIRRIQPVVLFMILHSLAFSVLNGSGHSITTIPLSTGIDTVIALSLTSLAVAGMIMIFYIIHQLILAVRNNTDDFTSYSNITMLEKFPSLLVVLLIITAVLFFTMPSVAPISMILLLVAEAFFILNFSTKVQQAG
ncbi:hypothetical protein [Sporosarcina sp. SAFN-010]|uniref:hypothetical protein n=1 Tax=Sporosarcina sp. SAFN-010 TaxID=3387273 RepID=UPI003F7F80BD